MRCSSPLKAYHVIGELTENGKKKIRFQDMHDDLFMWRHGFDISKGKIELMDLPCGHCIECRINKSKDWATRAVLESKLYPANSCYFVTLTYSDDFVPLKKTISRITGEVGMLSDLKIEHLQQFVKKLRRYFEYHFDHKGIRFLASGEYGEIYGRAHFHVLLFNCPLPDLEFHHVKNGNLYYTSKILEQAWRADNSKEPRGIVTASSLSYQNAAYTARYVLKKMYGNYEDDYQQACKDIGVEPQRAELINVSRRPGIAAQYFYDNVTLEYFKKARKIILENGRQASLPRYFEKLFVEHPPEFSEFEVEPGDLTRQELAEEVLEEYKEKKKREAIKISQAIQEQITKPFNEYMKDKHEDFLKKMRKREFEVL